MAEEQAKTSSQPAAPPASPAVSNPVSTDAPTAEPAVVASPTPEQLVELEKAKELSKKNPALSATLSLFVWGAGQMYNGDLGLGLLYLFFHAVWLFGLSGIFQLLPVGFFVIHAGGFAQKSTVLAAGIFFVMGIVIWFSNISQAFNKAQHIRKEHHGLFEGTGQPLVSGLLSLLIWGWGQVWNGRISEAIFLMYLMVFWLTGLLYVCFFGTTWIWIAHYGYGEAGESLLVFFWVFSVLGVYLWYQNVKSAFMQAYHTWRLPEIMARKKAELERIRAERAKEKENAKKGTEAPKLVPAQQPVPTTGLSQIVKKLKKSWIWSKIVSKIPFKFLVKIAAFFIVVVFGLYQFSRMNRDRLAWEMDQHAVGAHQMGLNYLPVTLEQLSLYFNPLDLNVRQRAALYAMKIGRWQIALKEYEQLYVLEPSNFFYRTQRLTCYTKLGWYEKACREYRDILSLKTLSLPQAVEALRGLGEASAGAKDFKTARDAYYTVLTLIPNSAADLERLEELRQAEIDRHRGGKSPAAVFSDSLPR